jgi:hypothetical protein
MSDRYAVPFQAFVTNGAVITSDVTGRVATAGNTTLTLSTTGGAGTFTITLGSGCTGTITSGTATITDSPKALVAGANTITSNGAGNCTLNLTLGTAANWNTVNTWSAATGGVSGASVPTSSDNVYFNANSFTAASQILTVDATANYLNMDWTGSLNTPTISLAGFGVNVYGNLTCIADMVDVGSGGSGIWTFAGTGNIDSGGHTFARPLEINTAGTHTFTSAITVSHASSIRVRAGTLNTNGQTINCNSFNDLSSASGKTLTLGNSTINCTEWSFPSGSLTMTNQTHTINVSGTGVFYGGGVSYGTVNLNGTAHTISGSNTFNTLTFKADTTQTITFTAGTTQTATTFNITGSSGKVKTLTGSGTWYLIKAGNPTLTVGAPVYASAATAGAITSTKPTTATNIQRIIGYGNAANELYFQPDGYWTVA